MIYAPTYNLKGERGEKVALPKKVFEVKASPTLLAQATRVYLANQRKSSAKTKSRGEVEGSTRKIYRQKGTGGARHGSIRAPIFVGGGIAHGPTGEQNYTLLVPSKTRRLAMLSALSLKASQNVVIVIEGEAKTLFKTKQAAKWQEKSGIKGKTLMIAGSDQDGLIRGFRNLAGVETIKTDSLNTYIVMKYKNLLITGKALAELVKRYAD